MLDAAGQMALDEAVLNAAPQGAAFLRFYVWEGPAVTFGLAQRYALAEALAGARGLAGVPVVRRPTGGGVVFHDGDVTFSLVFPWERLTSALDIYEALHGAIGQSLAGRGVETRLAPDHGHAAIDACFTAPSPFDLVTPAGRKVLGGAMRRRSGKGLYQGSLRAPAGLDDGCCRAAIADGARAALDVRWLERAEPAWLAAAGDLEAKYRSSAWNRRR